MSKKRKRWTKEEIELLKENYPVLNKEELGALFPDRSITSINSKAESMKLKKSWKSNMDITVKNKVIECGFEFIRTYRNEKKRRRVVAVCPSGHKVDCEYDHFRRANGSCKECKGRKIGEKLRKPLSEVERIFTEHGFLITDGKESYRGNESRFTILCSNGHTQELSLYEFQKRKHKCIECAGYFNDIDTVRKEFERRGYILISEEYKTPHEKLEYRCPKHPKYILSISWSNFKRDKGCRHCSFEKAAAMRRTPFNKVEQDFLDKGYIILCEEEEYLNERQEITYLCKKHKDEGTQITSYERVKQQNNNCRACIEEDIFKGDTHPNWKGGITSLSEYLRKGIVQWKKDSMYDSNYRCVISNRDFDVIHHLNSFSKIVNESLENMNLELKEKISDYNEEELISIKDECEKLHLKYGLGVCLSNEVHNLFHKEYGRTDNTPEQFEEFKERYENGEFDELLKERRSDTCE